MNTTLIQRAKIEDRDYKKGIDSIIELYYMGASEFEWGACPDSLKRIREDISEYTYTNIPMYDLIKSIKHKKSITIFCKSNQRPDIKIYLTELAKNTMYLQERSEFNTCFEEKQFLDSEINFWWDIENDLMFWIGNIIFETKFKNIIELKPE